MACGKRIPETQAVPIPPAVFLRPRGSGSTRVTKIQTELAGGPAAVERQVGTGDVATRSAGEETGQRREPRPAGRTPARRGTAASMSSCVRWAQAASPAAANPRAASPSGLPLNLDGSPRGRSAVFLVFLLNGHF